MKSDDSHWNDSSKYYTINIPDASEWSVKSNGIMYRPNKGDEPNAFHRFMQRLAFGFKWTKD